MLCGYGPRRTAQNRRQRDACSTRAPADLRDSITLNTDSWCCADLVIAVDQIECAVSVPVDQLELLGYRMRPNNDNLLCSQAEQLSDVLSSLLM